MLQEFQKKRRSSNYFESLQLKFFQFSEFSELRKKLTQRKFIQNCLLNTANLEKHFGKHEWALYYAHDKPKFLVYGDFKTVNEWNSVKNSEDSYEGIQGRHISLSGNNTFNEWFENQSTSASIPEHNVRIKRLTRFKLVQLLNKLMQ